MSGKVPYFVSILLLAAACGPARKIDRICTELFPEDEPGAAVLVMKGNRVIFDKGYGRADLELGTAIDGNTSFNIASVSKQFTAVAVLQLVAQGRVCLDASIADYFPQLTQDFWKDVKIKHLLSHSSGVPDERGYLSREERIFGDDELATAYLPALDHLHFPPGTAYEYINPTFVLLGQLVERVSGMPFETYMEQHVFLPSGMRKTRYFDRDHPEAIPRMAHGYEYADVSAMGEEREAGTPPAEKDWYEYDFGEETFFATRPDGGIYTSTHEFVRWERALRTGKVLPDSLLQEAFRPHTPVSGSPWSDYQDRPDTFYGYGWFLECGPDGKVRLIYHTGDNGGFKILAARIPGADILILVFANRADWDRYALLQQLEAVVNATGT